MCFDGHSSVRLWVNIRVTRWLAGCFLQIGHVVF